MACVPIVVKVLFHRRAYSAPMLLERRKETPARRQPGGGSQEDSSKQRKQSVFVIVLGFEQCRLEGVQVEVELPMVIGHL